MFVAVCKKKKWNTWNNLSKTAIGCYLFYHKTGTYCVNQLPLFEALHSNCGGLNWDWTIPATGFLGRKYTGAPGQNISFYQEYKSLEMSILEAERPVDSWMLNNFSMWYAGLLRASLSSFCAAGCSVWFHSCIYFSLGKVFQRSPFATPHAVPTLRFE